MCWVFVVFVLCVGIPGYLIYPSQGILIQAQGRPFLISDLGFLCIQYEKSPPSHPFPHSQLVDCTPTPLESMLSLPVNFKPFGSEIIVSILLFLPSPRCPLVVQVFEGGWGNRSHSMNKLKSYPTFLINTGISGLPAEDCQLDFTK